MTMRKTSIVVALCLVLIGILTATTGTAAPTDDSAIQRFDIAVGDYKYGELSVDVETDHVFAYANVGSSSADKQVTLVARKDRLSPHTIDIAHSTVNSDGQVFWKGTLTAAQLDWIHTYRDCAIFFVRVNHSLF
ncbi:MAG: hypothetical protein ACXW1R_04875 [Halobacteriota archaeon]